jgi:hypothetical protein
VGQRRRPPLRRVQAEPGRAPAAGPPQGPGPRERVPQERLRGLAAGPPPLAEPWAPQRTAREPAGAWRQATQMPVQPCQCVSRTKPVVSPCAKLLCCLYQVNVLLAAKPMCSLYLAFVYVYQANDFLYQGNVLNVPR